LSWFIALITNSWTVFAAAIELPVVSAATFVIVFIRCQGIIIIVVTQTGVHVLVHCRISHLTRRVAKLLHQYATRVRSANENFEGRVRFWSDGYPVIKFFQWEDVCLHQQPYCIVDDLCLQVWITRKDLYFLALFDPVE
jgi:hypothetical protein